MVVCVWSGCGVVGLWGCGVVAVYRHVDGNGVGEKEGNKRENVLAKRGKPVKGGVYIVNRKLLLVYHDKKFSRLSLFTTFNRYVSVLNTPYSPWTLRMYFLFFSLPTFFLTVLT